MVLTLAFDLRFDLCRVSTGRRKTQDEKPEQTGEQRSGHDAQLGCLYQSGRSRKGQHPDEQAHREADAAQCGKAINLQPGRTARTLGDAEFHREPDRRKYTNLLAQEQPRRNTERQRIKQRAEAETAKLS